NGDSHERSPRSAPERNEVCDERRRKRTSQRKTGRTPAFAPRRPCGSRAQKMRQGQDRSVVSVRPQGQFDRPGNTTYLLAHRRLDRGGAKLLSRGGIGAVEAFDVVAVPARRLVRLPPPPRKQSLGDPQVPGVAQQRVDPLDP